MAVDKVVGPIMAQDIGTGGTASESAVLVYNVTFTTNGETAIDALSADDGVTAIPDTGDAHPSDATLTVSKKSATRQGNSPFFIVDIQYTSNSTTTSGDAGTTPLSRPTRWNEDPRGGSVEIDTQSDGKVLINSAKQTLTTTIPYSDKNLTATRNVAARIDYDAFFNKVNNAVFEGYAAKRVLLTGVSQTFTEETYDGEVIQYYVLRYNFQLLIPRTAADPNTWEQRILDQGNVELKSSKQEVIKDRLHSVMTSFTKLDGSGARLTPGSAAFFLNNNPAAPTTNGKCDVFQTADFSLLGL